MMWIFVLIFFLGASVGSFINVVLWRTRMGLSLLRPPSQCPACRHAIWWRDNIPLLSFFLLGRRCRFCRSKIPITYPLVESSVGALFVGVALAHHVSAISLPMIVLRDLFIVATLVTIFLYDLYHSEIPDRFTLFPAAMIAVINFFLHIHPWVNMVFGALVGGGFFLLQFVFSRGRWIGGGDIRLGLLMGIILGFPMVIIALFFAYIVGAIVAVFLLATGKKHREEAIPFGTFLAFATFMTMYWGQPLLEWYMHLLQ